VFFNLEAGLVLAISNHDVLDGHRLGHVIVLQVHADEVRGFARKEDCPRDSEVCTTLRDEGSVCGEATHQDVGVPT
jgi:hypothetical protein